MARLHEELESTTPDRDFGTGWISGVLGLTLAVVGFGTVMCLSFPDLLTIPEARNLYNVGVIRLALHLVLVTAFLLAALSITLRKERVLGLTAISIVLAASLLGGSRAQSQVHVESDVYLGLDWFLINLLFTGFLFIPLERLFWRNEQPVFRTEWREDLFYFFLSSLLVQALTYLSLAPSLAILAHTDWAGVRGWVGRQPVVLQFLEIMLLTDLVQYWLHRAFHRVGFLWRFHSIHHSAQVMDWVAGSRMHFLEIVCLRGFTIIPMYILGFGEAAMYAYIFFVYLLSTFVHSNLRFNFGFFQYILVTPRFHHWHHGIEREAIDVNFAVHFPFLDRLFGTYHMPADGRWPGGYGLADNPVPKGFWKQLLYPFRREKAKA